MGRISSHTRWPWSDADLGGHSDVDDWNRERLQPSPDWAKKPYIDHIPSVLQYGTHLGPFNAPEDRELSMEQILRFLKAPMKFRGGPAARENKSPLEEAIGQRNKGK